MIIIKSLPPFEGKVRIFGAYTDINWTLASGKFKEGSGNSFLFSLRDDLQFIKLRCINNVKEVYHYKYWLCCFGNDLDIHNDCNHNSLSNSRLGFNY